MKKAFDYLDSNGLEYTFVDYKKQSPTTEDLKRWQQGFGELPVNTRGTTYRKIKADYEAANEDQKLALLLEHTSAIKRPILEGKELLLKGFDSDLWPNTK